MLIVIVVALQAIGETGALIALLLTHASDISL